MASRRAHVFLPDELLTEIDSLVGKRGRSHFIATAASAELRRQRQLAALNLAAGSWTKEDHPELKGGARKWQKRLRSEGERRISRNRSKT